MAADRSPREKGQAFVSEGAQTSAHACAACAQTGGELWSEQDQRRLNIIVINFKNNNNKNTHYIKKKCKSLV